VSEKVMKKRRGEEEEEEGKRRGEERRVPTFFFIVHEERNGEGYQGRVEGGGGFQGTRRGKKEGCLREGQQKRDERSVCISRVGVCVLCDRPRDGWRKRKAECVCVCVFPTTTEGGDRKNDEKDVPPLSSLLHDSLTRSSPSSTP